MLKDLELNLPLDGSYQIVFGSSWYMKNQRVDLTEHTTPLIKVVVEGKPHQVGEKYFWYKGELCPCFIKRK